MSYATKFSRETEVYLRLTELGISSTITDNSSRVILILGNSGLVVKKPNGFLLDQTQLAGLVYLFPPKNAIVQSKSSIYSAERFIPTVEDCEQISFSVRLDVVILSSPHHKILPFAFIATTSSCWSISHGHLQFRTTKEYRKSDTFFITPTAK